MDFTVPEFDIERNRDRCTLCVLAKKGLSELRSFDLRCMRQGMLIQGAFFLEG